MLDVIPLYLMYRKEGNPQLTDHDQNVSRVAFLLCNTGQATKKMQFFSDLRRPPRHPAAPAFTINEPMWSLGKNHTRKSYNQRLCKRELLFVCL